MMKVYFLALFFFGFVLQGSGQTIYSSRQIQDDLWTKLAQTAYRNGKPKFSKEIKKLEGETVQVKGYLYPLRQSLFHQHFILTSLPTSACFFCGIGGPETVLEVLALEEIKFTKKPIQIEGMLVLSEDDEDHLPVMIIDAKLK